MYKKGYGKAFRGITGSGIHKNDSIFAACVSSRVVTLSSHMVPVSFHFDISKPH